MDYDDFDNQFDSDPFRSSSDYNLPNDQGGSETGLDPLNFHDPVNSYSFLSDDAQDEISGGKKKNMKCQSCGHRFAGESYESCPECFSSDTEEMADEKDHGYW